MLDRPFGPGVVARAGGELPVQRLVGHRDPELLPQPLARVDEAPAHHAVDAGVGPLSITAASAARCVSFSRGGCPGALRSASPSGPRALNRSTQSRTICSVTPPILAASVRDAPS